MRLTIIHNKPLGQSESFVRAHVERLSGEVELICGMPPELYGAPLLQPSMGVAGRVLLDWLRGVRPSDNLQSWAMTCAYLEGLRKTRPDVVLIEYGTLGVMAKDACKHMQLPFVVHFHGHDASRYRWHTEYALQYADMFNHAAAIVAVSKPMRQQLLDLGAPEAKVHLNPYGVELPPLTQNSESSRVATFLAAGRFVEKKAPHLTILAFHRVLQAYPESHLHMIGDGPLLPTCEDLTRELAIERSVSLHGRQSHESVLRMMGESTVFVQHSVTASDGDMEGTPVAILEAGAHGLPVVSTRHAGIPEAVIDGETGWLVDERDTVEMAAKMIDLCRDPDLVRSMGNASRMHIMQHYPMEQSISNLYSVLANCCISNRD